MNRYNDSKCRYLGPLGLPVMLAGELAAEFGLDFSAKRAMLEARYAHCSLHDFSRETFMQRKLAVACATLCNTTLALAYSVSKLVNVNYGQKSYLLRKSWRFRSQVLKPVCRK